MNASTDKRQINLSISETVYSRLVTHARNASMPVSSYARVLFEAAYAARCGETGDRDLDATVAGVLILSGVGLDSETVARALKTDDATVLRIAEAWRKSRTGTAKSRRAS